MSLNDIVIVNVADVEEALRTLLADLDYDLHKSTEEDEETGEDGYPALAEQMFDSLRGSMIARRIEGVTISVSGLRAYEESGGQRIVVKGEAKR